MRIIADLVAEIRNRKRSISDVLKAQQQYHEGRRWSVYDVIGNARSRTLMTGTRPCYGMQQGPT